MNPKMTLIKALEQSPTGMAITVIFDGAFIITDNKEVGHQCGVNSTGIMPVNVVNKIYEEIWYPALSEYPLVANYRKFLEQQSD